MKKYALTIGFILVAVSLYLFGSRTINKLTDPASPPPSQVSPSSAQTASFPEGIFEGTTPCSNTKRPLPQIPTNANCRQMIWRIEFNPDSTFQLSSSYGMPHQGTTGIIGGGTKIEVQGHWTITRGTNTDPEATVIKLNTENPQESVSFLKVNDDIIHLLDSDKNLMVGSVAWSYTLNKTNGLVSESIRASSSVKYSSFLGTFEGRTPCADILFEFTKIPKKPSCNLMKWRLFLYQDPNTGNPTTYLLTGTIAEHEGTWEIVRGTTTDPKAVVYQLNKEGSEPLSLLKVDDNNLFILDKSLNPLVGDRLWSFTLSRTD
jgi:hypothetical protein